MKLVSLFGQKWALEGFLPGEEKSLLLGIGVTRKIYDAKSPYQRIEIFDTVGYGRVLFLDGFLQLATRYECAYHEMLVHPALLALLHSEKVLIVGGGDGGVLREVLKHNIKEVIVVEIDRMVVEASKKYLPSLSQGGFEDSRLKLCFADGAEFIKKYRHYFDCIILDLNDADGNSSMPLYQKEFLVKAKNALKPKGIFAAQTGYVSDEFGIRFREKIRGVFPFFQVCKAHARCFPADEHSFSFASSSLNLSHISRARLEKAYEKRNIHTAFYSPAKSYGIS